MNFQNRIHQTIHWALLATHSLIGVHSIQPALQITAFDKYNLSPFTSLDPVTTTVDSRFLLVLLVPLQQCKVRYFQSLILDRIQQFPL